MRPDLSTASAAPVPPTLWGGRPAPAPLALPRRERFACQRCGTHALLTPGRAAVTPCHNCGHQRLVPVHDA